MDDCQRQQYARSLSSTLACLPPRHQLLTISGRCYRYPDAIITHAVTTLLNFSWNYKRSVTNAGDHGFPDLWMLEQMQQLCHDMKWSYELPSCTLESVGIPIIHNVPVEAFSQQLHTDHARQAWADRKHKMSAAVPVALAAVQPTAQPALGRRAPDKPRTCTACKKPKLGTHERTGCPTHCLTCKNMKASRSCQPPVPPNLP